MTRGALLESMGLKEVARAGWLRVGVPAPESVAAHSWGVAWLVLALCPVGVDRERALAMALVHDLAEVRTGDITPHDGVAPGEKASREATALAGLVSGLAVGDEVRGLCAEYEQATSPEARLVKACDKLDMALQAAVYAQERGVDTAEFVASARASLVAIEGQGVGAPASWRMLF